MVAVSAGQSQWSDRISGSSTPRCLCRARTCIQPLANAISGSENRRTHFAAKAEGGPSTMAPAKSDALPRSSVAFSSGPRSIPCST